MAIFVLVGMGVSIGGKKLPPDADAEEIAVARYHAGVHRYEDIAWNFKEATDHGKMRGYEAAFRRANRESG